MFLGREIHHDETRSDKITQLIDSEIDRILKEAHDTARAILEEHCDKLELIAQVLIKYETIDGEQVMQMLETGEIPDELKNGKTPEEKRAEEEAVKLAAVETAAKDETDTEEETPAESEESAPEESAPEEPEQEKPSAE